MSHKQVMDIVNPESGDYIAMLVAFVAYFILSFLWWGPLFGKKWAAEMGMDMDEAPPSMTVPLILQAIGSLLLVYVLWHVMMAFSATFDHTAAEPGLMLGELEAADAMMGAFFTWLGFFVPAQLGKIAWEKGTWTLAAINAGGHLVGLMAIGLVFAMM